MGSSSSRIKLSDEQKDKLDDQRKKSICKIKINNKEKGYGFFCLTPQTKTKILIANYDTIQKEDIEQKKDLCFLIKSLDNNKYADMEYPRAFYNNKEFNISIVQILDEDIVSNVEFLEFDDNINKLKYEDKNIYILPYNLDDKDSYPVGRIKSIKEDQYCIKHNCENINSNNFYFPILLIDNYKLIGLNKDKEGGIILNAFLNNFEKELKKLKETIEKEKQKNAEQYIKNSETKGNSNNNNTNNIGNKGADEHFLDQVIKKNINDNNKSVIKTPVNNRENIKNKSNIILIIEVKSEDINKNIYFLDKKYNERKENGFSKEIEAFKDKIKLTLEYPNNKKEELKLNNYFKPNMEGPYMIEVELPGNIYDCSYMFYDCPNIVDIDLSNFNFKDVSYMNDMFNYCINLMNVKFSPTNNNQNQQTPNFKIEKIVNISYMFNYCKKLQSIDLSCFNTENVTNMSGMFQHCENLKKIDLSIFRTKNVIQLGCMFNNCYNLETIDLPKNFCSNNLEYMPWMFYGCEKIQSIDLSSFNLQKKIDMTNMFDGCDLLKDIKVKKDYIQKFQTIFKDLADKFKC